MTNKDNLVAEWNRHDAIEAEVEHLKSLEEHEDKSEKELRDMAVRDPLTLEHHYECFINRLSRLLGDISSRYKTDKIFRVSGSSIGWRNRSGERILEIENGRELMDKITPDREFRAEVFQYSENELQIKVYSHDSPTGELYIVNPVYATTAKAYKNSGENMAIESAGSV